MSQAGPTFAVIMPVYNHEAYLAEAIESVVAQRWGHWRLWIVDDGSTDGSPRIAEAFAAADERISVLHQPNAGPAAARNRGVNASRGPWLAFLDSDDVYAPTALEDFAAFIAAHPEAQFCYGYRHRLNEDGSVTELRAEFQDRPTAAGDLFGRMFLSHLCVCYRRELFRRVGGYDGRLRSVEDYDLYLRMSRHTTFWPIGKATGLRRRHGKNISQQSGYTRLVQAAVLKRFLRRGGAETIPAEQVAARLGKIYYAAGREYFRRGCFRQACDALNKAVRYTGSRKAAALRLLARPLGRLGRSDPRRPPRL